MSPGTMDVKGDVIMEYSYYFSIKNQVMNTKFTFFGLVIFGALFSRV